MTKKAWAKLIILLVVLVLALIVIFQNIQPTAFAILFWRPEIPLTLIILASFLLGLVGGIVIKARLGRTRGK